MNTRQIVSTLGSLSRKWLGRDFSYRRKAVSKLVRGSGFSKKMAEAMLDALFSELTASKLWRLLKTELSDPSVLDGFARDVRNARLVHAKGPNTILHVFSANIPGAAVASFVLGLLAKSRNVGKLSRRDAGVLKIYLDSLRSHAPALARHCVLIPGVDRRRTAAWAARAGLVVAYGHNESLEEVRKLVPAKTPFIGYGHRVSIALVLEEALRPKKARLLARKMALDVWMADQRGCLSPVLVFVQKGGALRAEAFAEQVAEELERLEKSERSRPRRALRDWISMRKLRDRVRLAALRGGNGRAWKSASGLWMVGYDERPDAEFSAGSQIIRVKGFSKLNDLEPAFQKMKGSLQAVSLECAQAHRRKIAEWLGLFGANRICRAGKLQHPPITWHHDGKLNLASWLEWVDLEII